MNPEYIRKDNIVLRCDGLAEISPNDFVGVAKYFAGQIIDLPAADVTPVRRGKWNRQPYHHRLMYCCSLCGSRRSGKTNFCPNCGAKMDWRE